MSAFNIIKDIVIAINEKKLSSISNGLAKLPLGLLDKENHDELVSTLLSFCQKANNAEAVRLILDTVNNERIRVDILPATTNLFNNKVIDLDVLKYAISCVPEKEAISYYVDLINCGDDMTAITIAPTIEVVFPDIPGEDWNALYKLSQIDDDIDEEDLLHPPMRFLNCYFETRSKEKGVSISKPTWVKPFDEVELQRVPDYMPSVNDAVDIILGKFNQHVTVKSEETEEAIDVKDLTISQYTIATIAEKIEMLSPMLNLEPFNDDALFREFGPVNTIYSITPEIRDPDHPCVKYGGCRMLTCNEFEWDEDLMEDVETEESCDTITYTYTPVDSDTEVTMTTEVRKCSTSTKEVNWFTGRCQVCLTNIDKPCHAVRMPLNHGGWIGCYCSEHLKEDVKDAKTGVMVGRMCAQLETIGIRDR